MKIQRMSRNRTNYPTVAVRFEPRLDPVDEAQTLGERCGARSRYAPQDGSTSSSRRHVISRHCMNSLNVDYFSLLIYSCIKHKDE